MNKQFVEFGEKINALSFRERLLVITSIIVLLGFAWWYFFALHELTQTKEMRRANKALDVEIQTLDATILAIQKRIKEGVHKTRQQQLALLKLEFEKVKELLEEKTLALIEPEEMFELMQQLIFAESRLTLTEMKRKQVTAVFKADEKDTQQPQIYRHVLQVRFEGDYKNILKYIQKLESLEWKLLWDRITLKHSEYPVISVNIEISTLSGNKNWVGL